MRAKKSLNLEYKDKIDCQLTGLQLLAYCPGLHLCAATIFAAQQYASITSRLGMRCKPSLKVYIGYVPEGSHLGLCCLLTLRSISHLFAPQIPFWYRPTQPEIPGTSDFARWHMIMRDERKGSGLSLSAEAYTTWVNFSVSEYLPTAFMVHI